MSLDLIIDIVIDFRSHFLRSFKIDRVDQNLTPAEDLKKFKLEKFPEENWFVMLFTHYHNILTENITLRLINHYLEQ